MPLGIKHLIQCHCILPQYRNVTNPLFHKFTVFSVIDDEDTCVPKIASCNNCGAGHRIYDVCKSEILIGNEDVTVTASTDDFKLSLPESLFELLVSYEKEICDFEYSQFIIDNERWNSSLVLTKENIDGKTEGKLLKFLAGDKFRVESFTHREILE